VDCGLRVAGETAVFNNNPYAKNLVKGIQIAKTGKEIGNKIFVGSSVEELTPDVEKLTAHVSDIFVDCKLCVDGETAVVNKNQ
jgi:hypothetical protein